MYDIWRNLDFWLFSVDLNLLALYSNQLNNVFLKAHLAMYMIWRMNTTAKGSKKNTSPNAIHLQYMLARFVPFLWVHNASTCDYIYIITYTLYIYLVIVSNVTVRKMI